MRTLAIVSFVFSPVHGSECQSDEQSSLFQARHVFPKRRHPDRREELQHVKAEVEVLALQLANASDVWHDPSTLAALETSLESQGAFLNAYVDQVRTEFNAVGGIVNEADRRISEARQASTQLSAAAIAMLGPASDEARGVFDNCTAALVREQEAATAAESRLDSYVGGLSPTCVSWLNTATCEDSNGFLQGYEIWKAMIEQHGETLDERIEAVSSAQQAVERRAAECVIAEANFESANAALIEQEEHCSEYNSAVESFRVIISEVEPQVTSFQDGYDISLHVSCLQEKVIQALRESRMVTVDDLSLCQADEFLGRGAAEFAVPTPNVQCNCNCDPSCHECVAGTATAVDRHQFVARGEVRIFWGNCLDEGASTECCQHLTEEDWEGRRDRGCWARWSPGYSRQMRMNHRTGEIMLLGSSALYRLGHSAETDKVELRPVNISGMRTPGSYAYNSNTDEHFVWEVYCRNDELTEAERVRQRAAHPQPANGHPIDTIGVRGHTPSWKKRVEHQSQGELVHGHCGYLHCNTWHRHCETREEAQANSEDRWCGSMLEVLDRMEAVNDGTPIDPTGDFAIASSVAAHIAEVDEDTGDLYVVDYAGNCHGHRWALWRVDATSGMARIVAGRLLGDTNYGQVEGENLPWQEAQIGRITHIRIHPVTKNPYFVSYPGNIMFIDDDGVMRRLDCTGCTGELGPIVYHPGEDQWIISNGNYRGIIWQNGSVIIPHFKYASSLGNGNYHRGRELFEVDRRLPENQGPFSTEDFGVHSGWDSEMELDDATNQLYVRDWVAGLIWVIGL